MNNKINIAVIGTGAFGLHHIRGIKENENAILSAVCDIDENVAAQQAKQHNVPYYTDYKELLKNDSVDAVSIATPDFMHCEHVTQALRAGKHVLCEKPLALNLDECKIMIAEAKKSDRIFMVGQICRYTPSFAAVKEIIDRGEIGNIYFIESEYAHDYASMPKDSWRRRPDRHGMIGGGCHAVDLIRWLAGNPTEVFAYSSHMMLKDWPTSDSTIGIMKFESGACAKVYCSTGCKRDYTMRTVVYGTKGTIIVDNTSNTFTLYKEDESDNELLYGHKKHEIGINVPVTVANHNIKNEVSDFLNLINSNNEISVNAVEGASTVAVCSAILQSCESGQPVIVDYNFD